MAQDPIILYFGAKISSLCLGLHSSLFTDIVFTEVTIMALDFIFHIWHSVTIYFLQIRDFFQLKRTDIFSYFSTKTCVVGTHYKHIPEALLMNTNNICFHGEIRKILSYLEICNLLSPVDTIPYLP